MNLLKKFDLKTILIIVLIVVLVLRGCGNTTPVDTEIVEVGGKDYELVKQTIDTVVVFKEVKVPTYIPKYITKVETVEVEIPMDIDTMAIIKKFYSTYIVKDTLELSYDFPKSVKDSIGNKPASNLGFGIITDKISQNSIISRDVDWSFKIPTVYNTTIVKELPKTQLYWGFNGGFNKTDVVTNVTTSLMLKTKSDKIFQLGVGVQNNSNTQKLAPHISVGMYWKIKFGKFK